MKDVPRPLLSYKTNENEEERKGIQDDSRNEEPKGHKRVPKQTGSSKWEKRAKAVKETSSSLTEEGVIQYQTPTQEMGLDKGTDCAFHKGICWWHVQAQTPAVHGRNHTKQNTDASTWRPSVRQGVYAQHEPHHPPNHPPKRPTE